MTCLPDIFDLILDISLKGRNYLALSREIDIRDKFDYPKYSVTAIAIAYSDRVEVYYVLKLPHSKRTRTLSLDDIDAIDELLPHISALANRASELVDHRNTNDGELFATQGSVTLCKTFRATNGINITAYVTATKYSRKIKIETPGCELTPDEFRAIKLARALTRTIAAEAREEFRKR